MLSNQFETRNCQLNNTIVNKGTISPMNQSTIFPPELREPLNLQHEKRKLLERRFIKEFKETALIKDLNT